jgi:UDP-3-O-[3-hydroxymyristoyl] N-acetylglucosamine deacetylase
VLARYDAVRKTDFSTTLSNEVGIQVSTVEHLMAALYGAGIDNVTIEIDGPEVPIMDGSAFEFTTMLEYADVHEQDVPRQYIEITKELHIQEGGASITLLPSNAFKVTARIQFDKSLIGDQECTFSQEESFKDILARARTFGFKHLEDKLKSRGLARGASLENVVVLDGDIILNVGGLRYQDEFVRHKMLDLLGDFYLAGRPIKGQVQAFRPGHGINNKAIRTLLQDKSAYRLCAA